MPAETKTRLLDATAELFQRQGYAATGIKQILAEAQAPFGSLYHFFPGGKEELGATAVRRAGEYFAALAMRSLRPDQTPREMALAFYGAAAETLVESGYADACPIATVALEVSSSSEIMRQACSEVFNSWIEALAAYLQGLGIAGERARRVSVEMLMALEGAFLLCRALRSTEPMTIAGQAMAAVLEREIPARSAARRPAKDPDRR